MSGRASPTPSPYAYDTSADNSREVSQSRSTLTIDADAHEYDESSSLRERSLTDERKRNQADISAREIKSLLAWSNTYLSKRDFHATDLGADFADGVLLINLLEISTSGTVGKYCMRPIKPMQKLDNVSLAMVYMMQKGIKILSIDAHDIVAKKEKQILIVLWSILRFLTLAGLGIDQASNSARDIRSNLLNWCKESFGSVQVNDFWSSFRDGVAFCAIVDKMAPGHIDMGKIRPENAVENLRLAFSVAEKHLGIPSVLAPEDFAAIKGDEKAVMNYVCMLVSAAAAARNTSSQKEVEAARLREALLEAEQKTQQAHNEAEAKLLQQQKELEDLASKLASAQDQSSQSAENERKWRDTTNKWRESAKKWRESAEKWRASDEAKSQIIKKMQQQHELEVQKLNAEIYKMHREHEEVLERIREEKIREHTERKNDQPALPDRYRHIRSRSQLKEQHIKDTKSDMDLLMGMPDRAGFLLRRRPNATFHKNRFKKLHFVLHGDSMEYWTEDQQKKKGAFNLVDYRFASEIPADKRYKEDGKDYIVRLNTTIGDKSNLTFEFKAPPEEAQKHKTTADELTKEWMSAINTRIALLMYMKKKEARKGMGWGSNELVQFVTDPDAHELVISHRLGFLEPLVALRGALIGRNNITHIHLEAVELNDEGVEVIADIIKASNSIVSLQLPNNKIGPSGAGYLCEALKINQSLTSLGVQNNLLKDEGVMRIASALPQHLALTELNISGNAVADNGAIALSHSLEMSANKSKKGHSFPILQLAYNLIGDQGCIAIAQLLTKNASITEIDLEHNIVGDAGVQALAKAIEVTDSQIRALYLATNQISSKGIIALSHAFKSTAGELTVDVSNNQLVSRSGIAALVDINVKIDYLSLKLLKPAFRPSDQVPVRSSMSHPASSHVSPNQDHRRVSFNNELKVVVGNGRPLVPGEDIDEENGDSDIAEDDNQLATHFPTQTPKSKEMERANRSIAASISSNGKHDVRGKENDASTANGYDPEEAEINAQLEQNSLLKRVIGKDHDDGLLHPHSHSKRSSAAKPE